MPKELRYAVAPIVDVDVRDSSESSGYWTMSGYAAVFDETTTLYDGRFVKLTESIAPSAFDRVLREQPLRSPEGVVHFNLGHDLNRSVAATDVPAGQPGSLQLQADARGLAFSAKVPMDDPDGVAMAAKMRSGVLRQASFAFSVAKDEIVLSSNDDGPDIEHRTILELSHLYDVCATPQGAYAQTVSGLRSIAAALLQPVDAYVTYTTSASSGGGTAPAGNGDANVASPEGDDDGEETQERKEIEEKLEASIGRGRELLRSRFKKRKV